MLMLRLGKIQFQGSFIKDALETFTQARDLLARFYNKGDNESVKINK
jgi:hypothetical protein